MLYFSDNNRCIISCRQWNMNYFILTVKDRLFSSDNSKCIISYWQWSIYFMLTLKNILFRELIKMFWVGCKKKMNYFMQPSKEHPNYVMLSLKVIISYVWHWLIYNVFLTTKERNVQVISCCQRWMHYFVLTVKGYIILYLTLIKIFYADCRQNIYCY